MKRKYLEFGDKVVIFGDFATYDLSIKTTIQLNKKNFDYNMSMGQKLMDGMEELENGEEFSIGPSFRSTVRNKNKVELSWDMVFTSRQTTLEQFMNKILTILKKIFDCKVIDLSAEFKERNKTFELKMVAGEDSYR